MIQDDLNQAVDAALSAVIANTWAVKSQAAIWPGIVYDIESFVENQWVKDSEIRVGHVVTVYLETKSRLDFKTYLPQIRVAMVAVEGFVREEEGGDANYEESAEVYVKYIDFRIRTIG